MTVNASLPDSCRTVFIRQGISLHFDSQDKTAINFALKKTRETLFVMLKALSTGQTIYSLKKVSIVLKF
jgi:hypothetical protein